MLEKEIAQATRMAAEANRKVEQLRKKLVAESEQASSKAKRELEAARKRHRAASDRLKKARATLKAKATPNNQKKVDALVSQVQDLAESVAGIAVAAYEAAQKYTAVRTDLMLIQRKAQAADQAASLVEKAFASSKAKKAPASKKAPAKKKAAVKKQAVAKKKPAAKKAPAKKKPAARRKAAPKQAAAS